MFVFKKIDEIISEVEFLQPNEAGGKAKKSRFRMKFKVHPASKGQKILDDLAGGRLEGADLIRENALDVMDIVDHETKEKIPFSSDLLDHLLEEQYIANAMVRKYVQILAGNVEDERRKN